MSLATRRVAAYAPGVALWFLVPAPAGFAVLWGPGAAYALVAGYLIVLWRSQGARSVHDLLAGTRVRRLVT